MSRKDTSISILIEDLAWINENIPGNSGHERLHKMVEFCKARKAKLDFKI